MKNFSYYYILFLLFLFNLVIQGCQVSVSVTGGEQPIIDTPPPPPVLPPPPLVPSLNVGGQPTGHLSTLSNGAEIWGRADNISVKKILTNGAEIEAMLPTDTALGGF